MEKKKADRSISLFGIPIYRKVTRAKTESRIYLSGLYRETTYYYSWFGKALRRSYVLGMPAFGKFFGRKNTAFFLGRSFVFWRRSLAGELSRVLTEIFGNEPLRPVDGRKNVIVLVGNSGEIALLIKFFFEKLLKDLRCEDPQSVVVLCTKPYHRAMMQMYFPEVRTAVSNPRILERLPRTFDSGSWRVTLCFPRNYYAEHSLDRHFVSQMQEWFDFRPSVLRIPDRELLADAYRSVVAKLTRRQIEALEGKVGKGLVIVATEAKTVAPLPVEFREKLKDDLIRQGYVIFENRTDGAKDSLLTFAELYAVAERAAAVFALRSGLADFLSDVDVPTTLYYTAILPRRNASSGKSPQEVLERYTLRDVVRNSSKLTELCVDGAKQAPGGSLRSDHTLL